MTAFGIGFGLFAQMALARFLQPEQYGVYNFIFAVSSVLSVIASIGFQNSVVRLVPMILQENKPEGQIRGLFIFSSLCTLGVSLLTGGLIFSGLYLFGYSDIYSPLVLVLGVFLTLLMALARLYGRFLRGFKLSTQSIGIETTYREAFFLSALLCLFILGGGLQSASSALFLMLLSCLITAILGIGMLFLKQPKIFREKPTYQRKHWLDISWPMIIAVFALRLLRRTDIIILGLMVDPSLVGIYALAALFAEASGITEKAVMPVYSPRAAEAFKQERFKDLYALTTKIRLIIISGTFIIMSGIIFFSPYVFPFFGEGFEKGTTSMIILMAGYFISTCFGPVQYLLLMTRYERQVMKISVYATIANLILNPPMIYYFGLEGAAITTCAILIVRKLSLYFFAKKHNLFTLDQNHQSS